MFASNCIRNTLRSSRQLQQQAAKPLLRAFATEQPPPEQNTPAIQTKPRSTSGENTTFPGKEKPAEEWNKRISHFGDEYRMPRSVQAVYLQPLKRRPQYGVPVCVLQLRSYNVRNVEFMADFALRAAYYLKLPASGPVPLPRIKERWTVIRSNFVHKKSQENFERMTYRRLIQIQDGHLDVVQAWLAFLRKHAFHGVGMKANVWEFSGLDVGKVMDEEAKRFEETIGSELEGFGINSSIKSTSPSVTDFIEKERYGHLTAPLSQARKE